MRTPRPSTCSTSSRSTTPAALSGRPRGGSTARGSDATTPSTETVACWSASSRIGPASRTPVAAANAARASVVASAASVIVPSQAAATPGSPGRPRATVRPQATAPLESCVPRTKERRRRRRGRTRRGALHRRRRDAGKPRSSATADQAHRAGTRSRRSAAARVNTDDSSGARLGARLGTPRRPALRPARRPTRRPARGRMVGTPRTATHQTLTFGRICSSSLSPMPLTSPSSSTEANRPCWLASRGCVAPERDPRRGGCPTPRGSRC